jgi:hypothetical protein
VWFPSSFQTYTRIEYHYATLFYTGEIQRQAWILPQWPV